MPRPRGLRGHPRRLCGCAPNQRSPPPPVSSRKRSAPRLPALRPDPPLASAPACPLPAFAAGDDWAPPAGNCLSVRACGLLTRVPLPRRWLHELGLEGKVRRVTQRHNRRLRFDIRVARGMFRDALAALVAKSEAYGWHARALVPYHLRGPASRAGVTGGGTPCQRTPRPEGRSHPHCTPIWMRHASSAGGLFG